MKKIAINGFGRIGRLVFRHLIQHPDIQIVAINDLSDAPTLAHLLMYDTAQGRFNGSVQLNGTDMVVNDQHIEILSERDPAQLPWKSLEIDLVLECTGAFRTLEKLILHRQAGAKKVILSAPSQGVDVPNFVLGVNDHLLTASIDILSNASCTTNCLGPVVKIMEDHFGIESGFISTTHAYTADQCLQDAPHKDLRRARAAAMNIVPTSTGAAKAVSLVYPKVAGKLDAIAFRVPVITGSLIDCTLVLEKETTREEINALFAHAAQNELKGILEYTEAPLVSSDIIGNPHSSILDASLTQAKGKLVKIISWYDNEAGYAARLADIAIRVLTM
ncbi:MAG: type I glyceraldehyde-3-phosphate dehydrogenase [Saprospiraceae bacterium]|nr:type I glyceraldehyde-3-phosphate dehydrogenase [Saprospiraceae bacterium]